MYVADVLVIAMLAHVGGNEITECFAEMKLCAPQPLDAQHRLEAFDCGKPALSDWLHRHARQAQGSGSARTFVVCAGERVAGYFSLTVGQIDTLEAPERIRRGMGQYPIPLVILARLAVDLDYQGQGPGFSMLQDAIRYTLSIAEQAGIRALLTHPIDAEVEAFYRRFGFEPTPGNERQLIVLLKDARRFAGTP
jgi:GNAT superfamily N-acetyltransferase